MPAPIDHLVLTASNPAQARGYREQLARRERLGLLEGVGKWHVVTDPGGRRIGSGAATALALQTVAANAGPLVLNRSRVLIIHSGGDSRRLPAFAALGKAFLPTPFRHESGHPAAMFDLMLADLLECFRSGLPEGVPRVVVASGDVYLGLARHTPALSGPGVVGVGFLAPYRVASRHGVFVVNRTGQVTGCLQKPSRSEASPAHRRGGYLVDSGVFSLHPDAARALLRGLGVAHITRAAARGSWLDDLAHGRAAPCDLYQHIPQALLGHSTNGHAHQRTLATALRDVPFSVATVPSCEFLHVGTTRQMLDLPARAGAVWLPPGVLLDRAPHAPVALAVGLPGRTPRLPKGVGMASLPVGAEQWAAFVFGDRDDCKTPATSGGTFLNHPLAEWATIHSVLPRELWGGDAEQSLWTARLWRIGSQHDTIAHALRLSRGHTPKAPKLTSLAQILPRVNHARLIALLDREHARADLADLSPDAPLWSLPAAYIAGLPGDDQAARRLARTAARIARSAAPVRAAALLRTAHHACARFPHLATASRTLDRQAFEQVMHSVLIQTREGSPRPPIAAIRPDEVVWATCPVRIDLAGGWSDTPPICAEVGGSVINAAVSFGHKHPIQVVCKRNTLGVIRLTSIDLSQAQTIRHASQCRMPADPGDWAGLAKAALQVSGLVPPDRGPPLSRWLAGVGGLDLTLFSAVPKGSGLGTSSIFAAAILAALGRVLGTPLSTHALVERTSRLEQLLTTGGGWQDQVGGLLPGFKLATTAPGPAQTPRITPLAAHTGLLNAKPRMLLYYTGHQRLAKNILRTVVGRWLDQDPRARRLIERLKQGVPAMRRAIVEGDVDAFAVAMTNYWRLKCELDPGTTTPAIDALLDRVRARVAGYALPGAGGGGFLLMVARSTPAAAAIRRDLTSRPLHPAARFVDFEFDTRGLQVTVL